MLDSISTNTVKQLIMDAAGSVVLEKGASHLTFDALVKKTGLSKGGILYHFPNKKALLKAMVHRMIEKFETARDNMPESTTATLPTAMTYILASHAKDEKSYQCDLAVLAAAANDPELLQPLQDHYRANFAKAWSENADNGLATLLYLAMDGIWLLSALQLNFATPEQLDKVIKTALALAEGEK